jgi:ABC-type glycerol-3-phosphate transport system substrate-binding protein
MRKLIIPFFVLLFTLTLSSVIEAQATLTVNLPDFVRGSLPEDAFADFEADNGVTVTVVSKQGQTFYTPPALDLDQHLEDVATYASGADVLYVSDFNLSVEATRAGIYLDFAPLTAVGAAPTRSAWGWDGGQWALPYDDRTPQVIYDPARSPQNWMPGGWSTFRNSPTT